MVKKTLRFRLASGKGSVQEFVDAAGVVYRLGDVVDLPPVYEGEAWLRRVDPVAEVSALPGKIEPAEVVDPAPGLQVPFRGFEDEKDEKAGCQEIRVLVGVPRLNYKDRYHGYLPLILPFVEVALAGVDHEVFVTPPSDKG